jgi:hypothetical protein
MRRVDHGSTTDGSLRYRVSRAMETFALQRADQITTICEGLRGDIASRGIAPDRITVIPNAVDVDDFRFGTEPNADLRRALGLEGMTVIGFAGSFYAYEGPRSIDRSGLPSAPPISASACALSGWGTSGGQAAGRRRWLPDFRIASSSPAVFRMPTCSAIMN